MDQASEEQSNRTGLSGLWLIRELGLCPSNAAAPRIPQHFLQSKPGHSALISHWERRQDTWFKAGSHCMHHMPSFCLSASMHCIQSQVDASIVMANMHSDLKKCTWSETLEHKEDLWALERATRKTLTHNRRAASPMPGLYRKLEFCGWRCSFETTQSGLKTGKSITSTKDESSEHSHAFTKLPPLRNNRQPSLKRTWTLHLLSWAKGKKD